MSLEQRNFPASQNELPWTGEGKQKRRCLVEWFTQWKFLHWDALTAKVYCFPCKMCAEKNLHPTPVCADNAFSTNGLQNWKKAVEKFRSHENCESHGESVYRWTHYSSREPVDRTLIKEKDKQRCQNK